MENKKKNKFRGEFFNKITAQLGAPSESTRDDWFMDSPDLRLTKVFSTVLALHIVALAGILFFKFLGKSDSDSRMASKAPDRSQVEERELAGRADVASASVGPSGQGRYVVVRGDTLSGIASGLGVSSVELTRVNRLASADDIEAGMILNIPFRGEFDSEQYDQLPSHPTAVLSKGGVEGLQSPSTPRNSGVVYRVRSGDTVWAIAKNFDVTASDLLRYNGIARPELLQVGQVIDIPSE